VIHIGWPQGIWFALTFMSVGLALSKYGQRKTDSYDIMDVLIGPAIAFGLLYWGGFFS
jgi:hypothetical protein